jgi:hypothetical protein
MKVPEGRIPDRTGPPPRMQARGEIAEFHVEFAVTAHRQIAHESGTGIFYAPRHHEFPQFGEEQHRLAAEISSRQL